MPAALNHAQHHPDSMRPRRHCSCSATRGTSQRCRSNDEIAVTQSWHSVPPTECRDYLAERCRGALERGGVPQRRGRTLVAMRRKSEPSVTLLAEIEMQPACRAEFLEGNRKHTVRSHTITCYHRPCSELIDAKEGDHHLQLTAPGQLKP